MSSTQRQTLGIATTTIALSALIVLWLVTATTTSQAQSDSSSDEPTADESIPPRPQRTRTPFEPYEAGPDALAYDTLSDTPIPALAVDPESGIDAETYAIIANETKASIDDAQTWAETAFPHEVHQAFAAGSAIRRAQAAIRRAEYESGLAGADELGVK